MLLNLNKQIRQSYTNNSKFKDLLSQYALYKVWVKPSAELSFLYGNHILKAGLGRISENTPQYQGVVVFSMSDIPLGFGRVARSTFECRNLEPEAIVCFHQEDIGQYLREEATLI
ncbi:60s ribosome subunit biogenesis protein nip7 [Anaeramoeba flamelloides]|uniref:60s ribosome subunit biogenesis protein nip7 n=1 Tax=Anaeramoeba flamelloides TaxID=1746091 RepID=A0ABQ8X800_9EUKA|nr:60s ribosome subunit biogenesis protein nip7 [Anaeramoeba flamelloides]